MALTDTFIRQIKHKGAASGEKYTDGGSMYLLVKESGKYWRMNYRFAGKAKTLALGVYPEVSLAKARKRRDDARALLADDTDPSEAKRDDKFARAVAAANTFKAVAMEWHAKKSRGGESAKTTAKRLAMLENHVFPLLGPRPVAEIKPRDLLVVLQAVAKHAAYTAGRVREASAGIFRFAIVTGRAEHNPAGDLRDAIETPSVNHRPALTTHREFGRFVRDLALFERVKPLTKLAAQFALLTWTRPLEMRTARWDHIDVAASEWRVPAINMKRGKKFQAHTVPLSAEALDVLEQIKEISGSVPMLFPSIHGDDRLLSENTINGVFKRMGYQGKQSHHGLRASARSLLAERGWTAEALERQLDHVEGSQTVAAYARAQHLSERRRFMDDWGKLITTLEAGDPVSPRESANFN